jgi:hypothetical protein
MKNVCVAFDVLRDGVSSLPDHQYICCHTIFDIKMEDFCHKARLIAGGPCNKFPATLTDASVVSRETVCIALLLAALNDIDTWAADVLNTVSLCLAMRKAGPLLGKSLVMIVAGKP